MRSEPEKKRAITFFDGQNLYRTALTLFGLTHPDYDPKKLSEKICSKHGWELSEIRFYTGVYRPEDNYFWHNFWKNKLANMGRQGIIRYKRLIKYEKEKGIDIRIALDLVRLARKGKYDVGIIFSQDQDLTEAVKEVKDIARETDKWIRLYSAFPCTPTAVNQRGINGTDWIEMDRNFYDSCLDPNDYRGKRE